MPPVCALGPTRRIALASFEELDYRETVLGALELRRRRTPSIPDEWIYEVKLADRFLMSSLNHQSETALARVGLEERRAPGRSRGGDPWRVLVGGLGLGYTALAALDAPEVADLEVVDLLPEVIRWHEQGLVPAADRLMRDPRCRLVQGDALARLQQPGEGPWDVVLVDIDDSPEHLLDPGHAGFYGVEGLRAVRDSLAPGGVLAVWASLPRAWFGDHLDEVFGEHRLHVERFHNPLLMEDEDNPIYLASR